MPEGEPMFGSLTWYMDTWNSVVVIQDSCFLNYILLL